MQQLQEQKTAVCPIDHTTFGKQKTARQKPIDQPFTIDETGMWHIHILPRPLLNLRGRKTVAEETSCFEISCCIIYSIFPRTRR